MKTGAVIAWSGNGLLEDLERTAVSKAGLDGRSVTRVPSGLVVADADPVRVASRLSYLPGVSWIAVGFEFAGSAQYLSRLQSLARRYLRPGSSFRLTARVDHGDQTEGDLLLDGNGVLLKGVKGTRVDEKRPDVTFRVFMSGERGAVGVELRKGPGGVPTSARAKVSCLVSGGYHSSVVGWMAALSGYRVSLVHARADDESLRQVARLYAELSRRVDASGLKLEVLQGPGQPGERLASWLDRASGQVMVGSHPECRGGAVRRSFAGRPGVAEPLLLLQEDEVKVRLDALGLKIKGADAAPTLSMGRRRVAYETRRFGGRESDLNGVLDSVLS